MRLCGQILFIAPKHTRVIMYDRKMLSYQPNVMLSTMCPTSAPKRDLSTSGDQTPSFRGINLLSFVIAICIGIRHNRSTSHSPARKDEIALEVTGKDRSCKRDEKSFACTSILINSRFVGFLVVRSNVWISSWKYERNSWWLCETMKRSCFSCRSPCETIACREIAGTTGNRVQTAEWQSIRQLWDVVGASLWFIAFEPSGRNVNSVTSWVIFKASDLQAASAMSKNKTCTWPRW